MSKIYILFRRFNGTQEDLKSLIGPRDHIVICSCDSQEEKRDNTINFTQEGGTKLAIMYVLSFLNRGASINEIDNKFLLNQKSK